MIELDPPLDLALREVMPPDEIADKPSEIRLD
jgi:hypothetical protein